MAVDGLVPAKDSTDSSWASVRKAVFFSGEEPAPKARLSASVWLSSTLAWAGDASTKAATSTASAAGRANPSIRSPFAVMNSSI